MARKRRIKERSEPIHCLRQWRQTRGLSQEKLAERAGRSHGTISRLENGVTNLTRDTAAALAAALLIDIPDLFRNPDEPAGTWSLAERIARLPSDQRKMVETVINAFLRDADGHP